MSISSILVIGLGSNAFGNVATIKPVFLVENPSAKPSAHYFSSFVKLSYSKEPLSLVEFKADLAAQPLRDVLGVSATWSGTVIASRGCGSCRYSLAASESLYEGLSGLHLDCSEGKMTETGTTNVCLGYLQPMSHNTPADLILLGGSLLSAVTGKTLVGGVLSADCEANDKLYVVTRKTGATSTVQRVALSSGSVVCTPVPFPIANERVVRVSSGHDHTLFLGASGNVYSVGLNSRGQLGHGCLEPTKTPVLVEALAGVPMADVSCGGWHSMALSACGDLYSWGWNCNRQLGIPLPPPPPPEKGGKDTATTADSRTPEVVAVPTLLDLYAGGQNVDFVSVSAGTRHSVAVSDRGVVWGWGWSAYGQLGCAAEEVFPPRPIALASYAADAWVPRMVFCGPWNTFIALTRPVDA